MFKKEEKKIKDNAVTEKVNQDLIVHNMPNHSRLGSASPSKTETRNQFLNPQSNSSSNVKTVGGLIIIVGIIFVLALIYLSYRFLIKPQAASPDINRDEPTVSVNNNDITPSISEEAQIATTTMVETVEPGEMSLDDELDGDNDISQEDFLLPEEGTLIDELVWTPIFDTDNDGLTDEEELALGTNPNEIDTDKDGYLDLAEVKAGFNPTGSGTLELSEFLTLYQNSNLNYSFLYPKTWTLRDNNTDYLTIISGPDNSLMQISVTENILHQDIEDWIASTILPEADRGVVSDVNDFTKAINGGDNLHVYRTDSQKEFIYILSYIPAIAQRVAYPNIFEIMVNSFGLN